MTYKALGKKLLTKLLSGQVKRLRARHNFKVVVVAGSIGKTSTKISIARILQASRRVQWQEGNYNDPLTVPLVFFGHNQPAIFNILAWGAILIKNEFSILGKYPYEVIVAELGTDAIGTIKQFAYIKPDLAVITAVSPEHMEYFGTLDAVATEELAVLDYSKQSLVNVDDVASQYLEGQKYLSYGMDSKANYHITERRIKELSGQEVSFKLGQDTVLSTKISLLGDPGAKIALAAVASAHLLGLNHNEIELGLANISAFAGRMQVLPGVYNSTLIDDTYNASPAAAKAALDVLYSGQAPQRIAILGNMNEMGDYSEQAHREVGQYCDPGLLNWVVTIGPDANKYLAPAATQKGCQVKTFTDPVSAGQFVKSQLKEGAVVLAKGSQNKVFAEEALKVLLANPDDIVKLVRQSRKWLKIKSKNLKA